MRYRLFVLAATAATVFASADLARATFTLSFLPSAQAAPAGKYALDLFAQNDAGGTDGSNLQAVKIVFTGVNGTKVFFNTADLQNGTTPETYSSDQYNFGAGTGGTNVTDLGSSNLRIGTRTAGQHAFPNYPGDADSSITQDQATNGLSTWSADYAVLSAAVSVPTPTAPGARFARLVFNSASFGINFHIVVTLAGETGAGVDYTPNYGSDPPPVQIEPTPPTSVVFGSTVSNGQPFSVTIHATGFSGQPLVLALGTLPAGITGVNVTGGGTSSATFMVTGNVAYSLNKTTVTIPFTVTDNSFGGPVPSSFQLIVTPEPTALAVAGAAMMGLVRRRK